MAEYLFVYGTLRPGQRAGLDRRDEVSHVGRDKISGLLYNLGWYPGVKTLGNAYNSDSPQVLGDVFEIEDRSIMAWLDQYEGYPDLFGREVVTTASGKQVWVYNYPHDVLDTQWVESGDWLEREADCV